MFSSKYSGFNNAPGIMVDELSNASRTDPLADASGLNMIEEKDFSGYVSALRTNQGFLQDYKDNKLVSKEEFDVIEKMAEEGNQEAQHLLGLVYGGSLRLSSNTPRKDAKAVRLDFLKPRDNEKAVMWLQKAAGQNYAPAMRSLAKYYRLGLGGVTKDQAKASELRLQPLE